MKAREFMQTWLLTIPPTGSIALAAQMMAWAGVRHLPVIDGDRLVGVVTEHDVLSHRAQEPASADVSSIMSAPVQTASPEDAVPELSLRLALSKIGCLPILERGRLVGIVTSTDLLALTARESLTGARNIPWVAGDVMAREVTSVILDDLLVDAMEIMFARHIRHLPVVDEERRVIGIISERDIRVVAGQFLGWSGRPFELAQLQQERVAVIANRRPITVHPETGGGTVVRLLLDERVGALPVVDESGRLVGMVSYVDVLRHVTAKLQGTQATQSASGEATAPTLH